MWGIKQKCNRFIKIKSCFEDLCFISFDIIGSLGKVINI